MERGPEQKPKVDPMQRGGPADIWWKGLTGQRDSVDRFVRGKGLSNLNANELPGEEDKTVGFEPKAILKKLGADAIMRLVLLSSTAIFGRCRF
jgi:hypothetical protein